MSKLIKFYNIGVYEGDKLINVGCYELIDLILNHKTWKNKVRYIPETKRTVTFFDEYLKENRYTIVPFGSFRTKYQPKIGNINESNFIELRELQENADIIELSTFVYDKSDQIIAMEYNQQGAKKRDLELYLTSYIKEDSGKHVELIEMVADNRYNELLDSKQLRYFELIFNDSSNSILDFRYEQEELGLVETLIQATNQLEQFSDQGPGLILRANNNIEANMDLEPTKNLIKLITKNIDLFETAKLRYRNPDNDELEDIDLIEDYIELKTRIFNDGSVDNPSSELVGVEIISKIGKFYNKVRENNTRIYADLAEQTKSIDIEEIDFEIPTKNEVPEVDKNNKN